MPLGLVLGRVVVRIVLDRPTRGAVPDLAIALRPGHDTELRVEQEDGIVSPAACKAVLVEGSALRTDLKRCTACPAGANGAAVRLPVGEGALGGAMSVVSVVGRAHVG